MKIILAILILSSVAKARCVSESNQVIEGAFAIRRIEKVFFNCKSSKDSKSFMEVEQPGCVVHLERRKTKKGVADETSLKVYASDLLCTVEIGSIKSLKLQTTGTECCDYVEGDAPTTGVCEGMAKADVIRCMAAPKWKIVK